MSEFEIFRGQIEIDLKDLASKEVEELRRKTREAFGGAQAAADSFRERIEKFKGTMADFNQTAIGGLILGEKSAVRETRVLEDALSRAFFTPRKNIIELVSQTRLGFRNINEEGGNVLVGLNNMASAAADITSRFEKLAPVTGLLNAIAQGTGFVAQKLAFFGRITGAAGKDMFVLAQRANDITQAIRIQAIAWREEQRQAEVALKSELQLLSQLRTALKSGDEAAVDLHAALSRRFPETVIKLGIQNFNNLAENVNAAAQSMETRIQGLGHQLDIAQRVLRPVARSITGSLQTLGQQLNYVTSNLQAGSREYTRYTARAKNTARRVRNEMRVYRALGGTIDEHIVRNFKEAESAIRTLTSEQKRLESQQKRLGDGTAQTGSRIRNFIGKLLGAGKQMEGYGRSVRDAAIANDQLQQYVAPQGIFNRGLTRVGQGATRAQAGVHQLSVSLGSIVGMAGAVGGALGQIDPAFSVIIVGASKMADQFVRSFSAMLSVSGAFSERFRAMMAVVANSLMAFGLMATGTIVKTGLLAAEVKTAEITLTQIARNLADEAGVAGDDIARHVLKLRDALVQSGITTREATGAMVQFLRLKLPVERVEELGEAAQNLGVTVANMSSSEVFGRFIWFIQSANSLLLRQLGITTTAEQMYAKYAATIGKSSKTLTDQEKVLARINGIIRESASVTGVYEEAMRTAGKQLSSMKRLFEEALLTIGKRFEPALAKLIFSMNKLLEAFLALPEGTKDAIANVIRWTATFGSLLGIVAALIPVLMKLRPVIVMIGRQIAISMPWVAALSVAIAGIIALAKALKKAWDENFGGIQTVIKGFISSVKTDLVPILEEIRYWILVIKGDFDLVIEALAEALQAFFQRVVKILVKLRQIWTENLGGLRDIIRGTVEAIRGMLRALTYIIRGETENAKKEVEDLFLNMLTVAAIIVKDWIAKAAVWGWNLIVSFAQSMWAAAQKIVVQVFNAIGWLISEFLMGGSPPARGPLSHIDEWGRGIMETFLRAFGLADFGILKDVMAPIQKAFEDAAIFGTIGEMDIVPRIREIRTAVAGLLADFRKTGEINEEVFNNIKEQLGEAGADFAEYIRLVLRHQQAVKALEEVQREVAAAEQAGFVPQELRARLEAAQSEVSAAEEAVRWQKEFIAAQQETISLQVRQIQLLERMARALEKAAKKVEPEEEEIKFQIDIPDEEEVRSQVEGVRKAFGGLSEEFLTLKQQIKDFIDLPLEEKLKFILDELLKLVGFEFPEEWAEMDLGERLGYLFDEGLKYVKANLPLWISKLRNTFVEWVRTSIEGLDVEAIKNTLVGKIALAIWGFVAGAIKFLDRDEHRRPLAERLVLWFERVLDAWLYEIGLDTTAATWGERLGAVLGVIWGKFIGLIWDVALFPFKLFIWWMRQLKKLEELLLEPENIREAAQNFYRAYLAFWNKFVEFLNDDLLVFVYNLVSFFADVIEGFVAGAVLAAPEWVEDFWKVGDAIMEALKSGIKSAFPGLYDWFVRTVIDPLRALLPFSEPEDRSSPLYGLAEAGRAIVKNIMSGFGDVDIDHAFRAALGPFPNQLAGAVTTNNSRSMYFQYGAFYGAFPNVRTAADAEGIMGAINKQVIRGRDLSMVGGEIG